MINIGSRRELFVDDYLLDVKNTTAEKRLHRPVRKGLFFEFDSPWEWSGNGYPSIFFAEGKWRMYYRATAYHIPSSVAYAESLDGINWVKPKLGLAEFDGSKENNIIFTLEMLKEEGFKALDNLSVFYDTNPRCPCDERYKMLMMWCGHGALICFVSGDGIHFRKSHVLTTEGEFDSQNVAFYSAVHGRYFCYFRGEHSPELTSAQMDISYSDKVAAMIYDPIKGAYKAPGNGETPFVRDVQVMESEDFVNWSKPRQIEMNGEDYQLYTSGVHPYPRAPHLFVGFPNRYVERKYWTPTYDELCGKEDRLHRVTKESSRSGLATTDGMFMATRDGYDFTRYNEAFLPPPPENPESFVYGDGFISYGMMEVPSEIEGAENEYALFINEGYRSYTKRNRLRMYTIRLDGFVSLHAGGECKAVVTKPFTYSGEAMFVNIETSARGSVYFTLVDEESGKKYTSHEIFGNSCDKRVHFLDDEAVARLSGKTVRIEMMIHDADLYSIRFE